MKNKIITGIALCSLFITGCSLDKAYLNGPNASTFPATKSEVEAGVFATYKGLTLIDASSTPLRTAASIRWKASTGHSAG